MTNSTSGEDYFREDLWVLGQTSESVRSSTPLKLEVDKLHVVDRVDVRKVVVTKLHVPSIQLKLVFFIKNTIFLL